MDPTARFAELVGGAEGALPLDEVALLIALHGDPAVDVGAELARLDALAAGVADRTFEGLCRHLFDDLGFRGVDGRWDDPRSSYLHEVVTTRTGIPISLSILVMEVGRRCGVPVDGISLPGHFLVRDGVDAERFVDPFARGARLDRRGARARFHLLHGSAAPFDDAYLAPAGPLAIVTRVLANLERIATVAADRDALLWILSLRTALPGPDAVGRRRLAAILAATGRPGEAATLLESVADESEEAVGAALRSAARRLRSQLN